MPKLSYVGSVPVTWNTKANRYLPAASGKLSEIYNRLRPVPDPMIVTMGPGATPGGPYPWEGNDPTTGRRYVARKVRDADNVRLEEVLDA